MNKAKGCDLMVPETLLAMSDGEGMATPGEGDMVSLSIDADVVGSKDGKAMLKIKAINGEPYGEGKETDMEGEMDEDGEPTRDNLLSRMQALDNAPV